MNINLYEITNKFVELNECEDLTDEQVSLINNELNKLLKEKSTSIIGYIQNMERFVDALKSEEDRLKTTRKNAENKLARFKEYVKINVEKIENKEVVTDLGILKIVKNPISVEIIDEEKIPNKYKVIKQEIQVDKKSILNDFKQNGEIIDGVKFVTNKTSLKIK